MKLARVPIRLMLLISLVLVMSFSSTSFARKALRPVMRPDNTVASWQEVAISNEQAPLGVDAIPDAVGVFGYPHESIGLNIDPRTEGIDTTTPPTQVYTICAKGDELPESGPWNARCYLQVHTGFLSLEAKPMRNCVGEEKYDLIDKDGTTRTRKLIKYIKPFYGENGMRYKKMVYYYEPQDFRGTSLLLSKPSDETKDNEQLIYLPSIRRIRRTPSGQDMDSPTGMDLTFDQLDRNPGKWDMNIIGEKTIYIDQPPIRNCYGSEPHRAYMDGKHCVIVEMTPRNKTWPISRDVLYYDKASAACYYEEIYNKEGTLERTALPFMAHLYPKNPIYWTLGDLYAHNLLTDHKTLYGPPEFDRKGNKIFDYATRDWSNYLFWFDTSLPDEYFSDQFMIRGTR